MAEFEKVEFEFPDEIEEKQSRLGSKVVEPEEEKEGKEEEPEIEIVDDTPEEDRNRVPMATPPEDPTDEELASYSKRDRVKTREFHKAYHDERRAKEAANREKDEAIRIAQAVLEENNRLKGTVNESNSALLEQAKKNVANDLNAAKARYKQAYEAGDSDQLLEAQDEMTSIKIKAERLNNFRPKPLQEPVIEVKPEFKQAPQVDPKAENWFKTNDSWWGKDREMTGFALAVHDKLVIEDGVNPQSDEYYQRLNGRLRQVFPDKFESGESGDANRRPKSNVVASATRSTAPKKIVLNASEVAIARKLNIPLERYAKEVAILRRNGNG